MEDNIYLLYKKYALDYKLSNYDTKKLWKMIENIVRHPEFVKRCKEPYFHHDIKMLGEHILCDAIVTYKLAINLKRNSQDLNKVNVECAVVIAMFHDLYELPWQNMVVKKKFKDKHGFTHPLEAVVNAITWYPEYFKNKDKSLIIIDGIIHHMYPLPVRIIDKNLDLNNLKKYKKLDKKYQEMMEISTKIGKIGSFSLRKTFFIEGRIMSKADKLVSLKKDIKSIDGYIALVSGKNKKLKK